MDSTLLDIGAQCSLPACTHHDFLPIFCPACSNYFCNDHIHSDLHPCPAPSAAHSIQHDKLQRCALGGCDSLSLDAYHAAAAACTRCNNSFCAEHRHPVSHNCIPAAVPSESATKNEKARALLAKIPSSPTTSKIPTNKSIKVPKDPAKLVAFRRIELMKMRHKAVPLDPRDRTASPPLDERLHVKILYGSEERVFWMRKTLVTGKALDLLCTMLGHTASNLALIEGGSECRILQNGKSLSEQVEDGSALSFSQAP